MGGGGIVPSFCELFCRCIACAPCGSLRSRGEGGGGGKRGKERVPGHRREVRGRRERREEAAGLLVLAARVLRSRRPCRCR